MADGRITVTIPESLVVDIDDLVQNGEADSRNELVTNALVHELVRDCARTYATGLPWSS